MKRTLLILYIAALVLLAGCEGNLFSSHRDMERLRPVQTMGFDGTGEGVTVSVSTGLGPEDAPSLVMTASGTGVEDAIAALQDYSPEDELFYAHVRYVLLGESVTGDRLMSLLDWVERSPSMRLNTNLLLIRGRADSAVTGAMGDSGDVTERLVSLEREELARGRHLYTRREAAAALLERGGALCLTAKAAPTEGVIHTEGSSAAALIPTGYAVLRDGGATVFLTPEETLGTELLEGGVNGARVEVDGNVLEIIAGSGRARLGRGRDGKTALVLESELTAGLLETDPEIPEPDLPALERSLAREAEGWLTAAVSRSRTLGCDFLDLQSMTGTAEALSSRISVETAVTAVIDRSYDRR